MKLLQFLLGLGATVVTARADSNDVAAALWDGKCFYPQADASFNLKTYSGRWYLVAATLTPFTASYKCISARYDMKDDGSLYVNSTSQIGGKQTFIEGSAIPADAVYGKVGVLRVEFPMQPSLPCDGPNYVVQKYTGDMAIVQSANFSNLFILSRKQLLPKEKLDAWINRAVKLGTPRESIDKTDQTYCK